MSSGDNPVVEYGNDVEGTAFCSPDAEDPLGSSSWNLQASSLFKSLFFTTPSLQISTYICDLVLVAAEE